MELRNNKKAQLGKRINAGVTIIITVVVLFLLFADLIPEVQSSGNQLGDAERCSVSGGFFNTTQSACLNGTSPADTGVVGFDAIPLSSLFSGSGVVVILLMVFLLIIVIQTVLPRRR